MSVPVRRTICAEGMGFATTDADNVGANWLDLVLHSVSAVWKEGSGR